MAVLQGGTQTNSTQRKVGNGQVEQREQDGEWRRRDAVEDAE